MKQHFLKWEQLTVERGLNPEALRQAMLAGVLDAYVELREVTALWNGRADFPASGREGHCSWIRSRAVAAERGEPDEFFLAGWFQLIPASLHYAALHGGFGTAPRVWPCEGASKAALSERDYFKVEYSADYQPTLDDLWFRAADIDAMLAEPVAVKQRGQPKLRSDREENLLKVIAGMWALSSLPREHNTAADKLSALFQSWGWEKPAKGTMADTILKDAANLPGADIRK